jgi:dihydroflavonol-4-reductase
MRVLVTGATGKVGNAVARRLVERGDRVVALVRDPARARKTIPEQVEPIRGDVTDAASVRRAADGVEAVFNCMGMFEQWVADPASFDRVNAEGARNVAVAAREAGAARLVHTSTFDVFDAAQGGTVSEERVADYPKGTAYERSKQRAESLVLAEAVRDDEAAGPRGGPAGLEVVIVNPSAVYGPGPWARAGVDGMLRDALRRRLPATPPGGMTLVHVDDVAAGHLAALEHGRPGERYILADGFAIARDLVRVAVEEAGRGWVPPSLSPALARRLAALGERAARLVRRPPPLPAGQLHFLLWQARADSSKAQRELGLEFVPWERGIRQTVRWMLEDGHV